MIYPVLVHVSYGVITKFSDNAWFTGPTQVTPYCRTVDLYGWCPKRDCEEALYRIQFVAKEVLNLFTTHPKEVRSFVSPRGDFHIRFFVSKFEDLVAVAPKLKAFLEKIDFLVAHEKNIGSTSFIIEEYDPHNRGGSYHLMDLRDPFTQFSIYEVARLSKRSIHLLENILSKEQPSFIKCMLINEMRNILETDKLLRSSNDFSKYIYEHSSKIPR